MKNHKSHKLSDLNINGAISEVYMMDCVEAMKQYPDKYFDLAVCDPPYGGNDAIGLKNNTNNKKQASNRTEYRVFDNVAPSVEYFKELKRVSREQVIWGVNFYNNFDLSGGRLCWDKKGTAFGRAELAYLSMTKSVNICEITWNGMIQHNMKSKEGRIHPTQKPVALYDWIFKNYAKEGDLILDTHIGSQSSRIAANRANLDFIGFEIDEDYFNEGNERFKTFVSQMRLF